MNVRHLLQKYQIFNFLVVFAGRGLGNLLNLAFVLVAANLLGREEFGLFSVSVAVMQIALQFGGQGLDTALVRFYVSHVQERSAGEQRILHACLYLRIILTAATLLVGIGLAELYIAYSDRAELRTPVLFGFIGCAVASFWHYGLATVQATEKYTRYALLASLAHAGKILLLAILLLLHWFSLFSLLVVHVLSFLLGAGIVSFFSPLMKARGSAGEIRRAAVQLFGYGKWIMFSSVVTILYSRLDILALTYFADLSDVGGYAAAISIIHGFDLVIVALFTVFLPNASKIRTYEDVIKYGKFAAPISLLFAGGALLVFGFADRVFLLLLGEEFRQSAQLFKVVFPGFLLHLFVFPWALVIYAYNKPHLLFGMDVCVLVLAVAGYGGLVPSMGALGAAWVNLSCRLVNTTIIVCLVVVESARLKRRGGTLESVLNVSE